MSCGIYKVTNNINGHAYIGQSIHIERRWHDHKMAYKNKNDEIVYNYPLYEAIRKYGLDSFEFEIIEECEASTQILDERERYWIAYYDTFYNGYNQTEGGEHGRAYVKFTPESLQELLKILQSPKPPSQQELSKQFGVSSSTISDINTGRVWRMEGLTYPLHIYINKDKSQKCAKCGKVCERRYSPFCKECEEGNRRKVLWPDKETLWAEVQEVSLSKVGRKYGVAAVTISRWLHSYGLPCHRNEINKLKPPKLTSVKKENLAAPKPIAEFDATDNVINIFSAVVRAQRYYGIGHIAAVCLGKRKTTGGHRFKYLSKEEYDEFLKKLRPLA